MDIGLFLAYILTISVIIATPGPNVLLVVSHSVQFGKRAAFLNASGGVLAALILMAIALFGVSTFIPKNTLPWLSIAGSLYLIWISYRSVFSVEPVPVDSDDQPTTKSPNYFLQAFGTGISNPKDILFFLLFLPQFIDKTMNTYESSLILMLGWFFCDFGIILSYGLLSHGVSKIFDIRTIRKIRIGIGCVIGIIGLVLLYSEARLVMGDAGTILPVLKS